VAIAQGLPLGSAGEGCHCQREQAVLE